jgi:hypothetical protein
MALKLRKKFIAFLSKDIDGDGTVKRCDGNGFTVMTELDTTQGFSVVSWNTVLS